jgi:NADH-quinone oxidoreductase subunit C
MTTSVESLASTIAARCAGKAVRQMSSCGELTFEVGPGDLLSVCRVLRDDPDCKFEQLIDVTGVDYLTYGQDEWTTEKSTKTGFSRGVHSIGDESGSDRRFAVVYHLLSIDKNLRVRLKAFCPSGEPPMIDSVVGIWASANWFEREIFDLYGVLFQGHPDLRRILTDYGFIGHPFRKDFPVMGNVEVKYDPEQGRVIYQPVTIEPRTLVPRVIRDDNRYDPQLTTTPAK